MHSCKQIKTYNNDAGLDIQIIKEDDFEDDIISGWLLTLPNGVILDIFYCPYCGKKLVK